MKKTLFKPISSGSNTLFVRHLTCLFLLLGSTGAYAVGDITVWTSTLQVVFKWSNGSPTTNGSLEVTDLINTKTWTQELPPSGWTVVTAQRLSDTHFTATVQAPDTKQYSIDVQLDNSSPTPKPLFQLDLTPPDENPSWRYNFAHLPPYPFMFKGTNPTDQWYYVQNNGGEGTLMKLDDVNIRGRGGWAGSQPWWGVTNLNQGEAMMARLKSFVQIKNPGANGDRSAYEIPLQIEYSFYNMGGYVGLAKAYRDYFLSLPNPPAKLKDRALTQPDLLYLQDGTYAYFWDDDLLDTTNVHLIEDMTAAGLGRIIAMFSLGDDPDRVSKDVYDKIASYGWLGGQYKIPTPNLDHIDSYPDWVNNLLLGQVTETTLLDPMYNENNWAQLDTAYSEPAWNTGTCTPTPTPGCNSSLPSLATTYGNNLKVIYHDTLPQQLGPSIDRPMYNETIEENLAGRQKILDDTRLYTDLAHPSHFVAGSGEGISAWWTVPHLDYWEGGMEESTYGDISRHPIDDHCYEFAGVGFPCDNGLFVCGDENPSDICNDVTHGETWYDEEVKCLDETARIPLLALQWHDYIAEAWNWRNSTFVTAGLSWKKDLFNILYGGMPMWHVTKALWDAHSTEYIHSYSKLLPVRTANGFAEMTWHAWDPTVANRAVQYTDWDSGKRVIVNFSETQSYYYPLRDVTVAPKDYVMLTTNGDNTAPGPVTNLTAIPGDTKVTLNWTNPSTDFASAIVRRGTTQPMTPSDGTAVPVVGSQTAIDTGLTNGTPYYYSVFAKDAVGNYSAAAQVSATPAAIAFRAATSANTGSSQATSLTISKPTGVLNGDLLLAGISFENQGATVTPPSGWTRVRHISAGVGMDVYRKTAGSGEPASYQWSFSSTNKIAGGIIALSSVNLVTPIQGENGTAETVNRTTHTTPTISTTGSTTWLVTVFGDKNNTGSTWTPPSGHTERVDTRSTGTSAASVEINTKGPVSAGSQSATATASVTSSLAAMEIIAVQP